MVISATGDFYECFYLLDFLMHSFKTKINRVGNKEVSEFGNTCNYCPLSTSRKSVPKSAQRNEKGRKKALKNLFWGQSGFLVR